MICLLILRINTSSLPDNINNKPSTISKNQFSDWWVVTYKTEDTQLQPYKIIDIYPNKMWIPFNHILEMVLNLWRERKLVATSIIISRRKCSSLLIKNEIELFNYKLLTVFHSQDVPTLSDWYGTVQSSQPITFHLHMETLWTNTTYYHYVLQNILPTQNTYSRMEYEAYK